MSILQEFHCSLMTSPLLPHLFMQTLREKEIREDFLENISASACICYLRSLKKKQDLFILNHAGRSVSAILDRKGKESMAEVKSALCTRRISLKTIVSVGWQVGGTKGSMDWNRGTDELTSSCSSSCFSAWQHSYSVCLSRSSVVFSAIFSSRSFLSCSNSRGRLFKVLHSPVYRVTCQILL